MGVRDTQDREKKRVERQPKEWKEKHEFGIIVSRKRERIPGNSRQEASGKDAK